MLAIRDADFSYSSLKVDWTTLDRQHLSNVSKDEYIKLSRTRHMSDTEYTLKLTGNGVTLDRKISKELGERVAMLIISDGTADVDRDVETKSRKDGAEG